MTATELAKAVGKRAKATNPDLVASLRETGHATNAYAVGLYIASADPEMFDRIVAQIEQGE